MLFITFNFVDSIPTHLQGNFLIITKNYTGNNRFYIVFLRKTSIHTLVNIY